MNVSDEIKRIDNELKYIKLRLSNTRQNESSHNNFIGLIDTPASYVGQGSKFPAVNVGGTALEFRAADQILAYLSANAGAAFDWNAQNLTNIGALTAASVARFGAVANHAAFAADGELTLTGTARVYRSAWIAAGAIRSPGAKPATLISHGLLETPAWQFAPRATEK